MRVEGDGSAPYVAYPRTRQSGSVTVWDSDGVCGADGTDEAIGIIVNIVKMSVMRCNRQFMQCGEGTRRGWIGCLHCGTTVRTEQNEAT